jgi:hypothetical protein
MPLTVQWFSMGIFKEHWREQAIARFDRWSMSDMGIYQQLTAGSPIGTKRFSPQTMTLGSKPHMRSWGTWGT